MRIALIGAAGFVGAAIATALQKNGEHQLVAVTRATYEAARAGDKYDVLINAAMPSRRFWAKQNPQLDFHETVEKTSHLLNDWTWDRFVQISSISARSQLDTVYGRHKAAAEKLCAFGDNLVLRLGPMYGSTLDKGVLIDLIHDRTVFVSPESRYCFAPVGWIGSWIADNLQRTGILDLGGNDAISIGTVAKAMESHSRFEGAVDDQILSKPIDGAPSASAVIDYLHNLRGTRDAS